MHSRELFRDCTVARFIDIRLALYRVNGVCEGHNTIHSRIANDIRSNIANEMVFYTASFSTSFPQTMYLLEKCSIQPEGFGKQMCEQKILEDIPFMFSLRIYTAMSICAQLW